MARPTVFAVLTVLALGLGACGRMAPLDTPVSVEQAVPWTEEGRRAANPPRGADGRPERVPTQPRPTPPRRDFPLDVILN